MVARSLRIGTRRSALALWQAEHVAERLRSAHPGLEVSLVQMSTLGDRFLGRPLAEVGGKGLFVQEIEAALVRGEVDLAVHSLKDLPSESPLGLILAPPPRREDARDALVSRTGQRLAGLPQGARIGTSSLRRAVQLRAQRPDAVVVPIRGNVQTRLDHTLGPSEEPLDAVVLALAGLRRLGLERHVAEALPLELFVPAIGQGILGVQQREADDHVRELLLPLADPETDLCARAERSLLARLGAGCHVPLGGHARLRGGRLSLLALLGDPASERSWRIEREAPSHAAERLGREVAEELLAGDGARLLAELAAARESSAPPES